MVEAVLEWMKDMLVTTSSIPVYDLTICDENGFLLYREVTQWLIATYELPKLVELLPKYIYTAFNFK